MNIDELRKKKVELENEIAKSIILFCDNHNLKFGGIEGSDKTNTGEHKKLSVKVKLEI